jgi:hypothetical protein
MGIGSVKVGLLNSCWGCGSSEYIPREFCIGILEAIEDAISKGEREKAVHAYYERQFGTPAFSHETISNVMSVISEHDQHNLFLICAHHNLIPQRIPRLAPYTEIVNSGALRHYLLNLKRPVIYLHSHIHDDPIDLMNVPNGDAIVSVSAPEVRHGFNLIELVFTSLGVPLICNVTKWRFNESGIFGSCAPIAISLLGHRRRSTNSMLSKVYSMLLEKGKKYWQEAIDGARTIFSGNIEENISEALEFLYADGSITIDNYALPPTNWIVGARI